MFIFLVAHACMADPFANSPWRADNAAPPPPTPVWHAAGAKGRWTVTGDTDSAAAPAPNTGTAASPTPNTAAAHAPNFAAVPAPDAAPGLPTGHVTGLHTSLIPASLEIARSFFSLMLAANPGVGPARIAAAPSVQVEGTHPKSMLMKRMAERIDDGAVQSTKRVAPAKTGPIVIKIQGPRVVPPSEVPEHVRATAKAAAPRLVRASEVPEGIRSEQRNPVVVPLPKPPLTGPKPPPTGPKHLVSKKPKPPTGQPPDYMLEQRPEPKSMPVRVQVSRFSVALNRMAKARALARERQSAVATSKGNGSDTSDLEPVAPFSSD